MFSGFDVKLLKALGERIDGLERRSLERTTPNEFDLADILDGHSFFKVEGLANFWDAQADVDFRQYMVDMIVGAHDQQHGDITFVLVGNVQDVAAFLSLGNPGMTKSLLKGILPGIRLGAGPETRLAHRLSRHFQTKGLICGIPSRKRFSHEQAPQKNEGKHNSARLQSSGFSASQNISQLERIVRGMYGATWAYVVQAHPRPRDKVIEERLKIVDVLADVMSQSRIQLQATEQESQQTTSVSTGSTTKTFSGEMVNYRAQYLVGLLEWELERLDQAVAAGQWLVSAYFGASNPDDAQRLASLVLGTLAGKDSRPDPLRAFLCRGGGRYLTDYSTFLSSDEVANMIQLPREEVPGYAIFDFVRFDVDFHISSTHSPPTAIALGYIQHNDLDAASFQIDLNDLAKHGVVVGVTGSGKTTTVMNLLDGLVEAEKPFLIIEPAKTEYRALRGALAARADVRIYTLGNENIAPFRLNPFEFETDDTPGSASVVNHVDFLKAVFNAAFILYAPMPYVLETALHEVYEDKGWDLATGLNNRLPRWTDRHLYPIFPTLTDLYRRVDVIVDRLGYDTRIEQDVKAGLKARIGSMRIGSKGLMLDTARGIPMQQLLAHPTILEMENIGGDDEKTFLMGLLLAKLYEYRRLQAASGSLPGGLQHLIVFEEAHRLLKNTETQVDTESSNKRSQAIEVFTNMLSEVRAYGQGVLVAEQIPSKLAPDVLKNTNLKIAHRLIAQDDRESVGQTMNLNDEQMKHLGILKPGMAAIYAEGADHAYKVRLENYKRNLSPLTDTRLKTESPKYASVEAFLSILDIHRYGISRSAFGAPDATVYQAVGRLLETSHGQWLWASMLVRTVYSRPRLPAVFAMLRRQIEAELTYLQPNQRESALRMAIVRGCSAVLSSHCTAFGWSYPLVEELRLSLTRGLIAFAQTKDLSVCNSDLDRFARKYEKLLEREQGPFAGCIHCRARCMYRLEVRHLLLPQDKRWISSDLQDSSYKTRKERYTAIASLTKGIAERWLGETNFVAPDLAYCGALHAAADLGLSDYEQAMFADSLSTSLLI